MKRRVDEGKTKIILKSELVFNSEKEIGIIEKRLKMALQLGVNGLNMEKKLKL